MYADDHDERLVYNLGVDRSNPIVISNWDANWVDNVMTWELDPGNTNMAFVTKAKLTAYSGGSTALYRCPADRVLSAIQKRAGWKARVRSISRFVVIAPSTAHFPTRMRSKALNAKTPPIRLGPNPETFVLSDPSAQAWPPRFPSPVSEVEKCQNRRLTLIRCCANVGAPVKNWHLLLLLCFCSAVVFF